MYRDSRKQACTCKHTNYKNPIQVFRPTINSSKCPHEMIAIIATCWATRAEDRPETFDQVCVCVRARVYGASRYIVVAS